MKQLRTVGVDERDPDLRPARIESENITGACDIGAHRDCAPSAAMRAAGGCECFCHRGRTD